MSVHHQLKSLHGLLPLLLLCACNPQKSPDEFEVAGNLRDYPNSLVYLNRVTPTGFEVVDSTQTNAQGEFSLRHAAVADLLYTLRLENNQSLLIAPGRDRITVTASAGQLSTGVATGNAATASLQAFARMRNQLRSSYAVESRNLSMISRNSNPQGWQLQEAKADLALKAYREYVRAYADTVPVPALAWYATSNLHVEGDFYYIQQFVEGRKAAGEQSSLLDHMENQILTHGNDFLRFEAQDFLTADVRGDSIALSSRRGKVTYLFVWASYCGLSRMETQRLASWRHSHPDVPIEILTFSIDEDEAAWRKAIQEDSLDWPGQLRGMLAWGSPEIAQFDVKSIPVSFILDARGIIRSKNAHSMDLERDYVEMVRKWGGK